MKKGIFISVLSFVLCLFLCSFTQPADEAILEGFDDETKEFMKNDLFEAKTGTIHFPECHASITVPEGFVFLNKEEAKYLLVDYWNNPEDRATNLLGVLVPNTAKAYFQVAVAYVIKYDNCGYIKDDDANSVNYTEMLKDIQKEEKEENKKLPEDQRMSTLRWEFPPKYLRGSHVLVWAKHLSFIGGDAVNYDMRILGKDGLVSLMAVIDPSESQEVKDREQSIINSLSFDKGYAYSDFDSSRDRVSDWTIGGLVAGSILAKSGFFAKIGVFLLKFWKIIALAVAGIGGALFKKKKEE